MPTPPQIDDDAPLPAKLRFAIAHKRLRGFEYYERLRVGEPHDFGAMNGAAKLLVYQLIVDGAESRRLLSGSTCGGMPFSRESVGYR